LRHPQPLRAASLNHFLDTSTANYKLFRILITPFHFPSQPNC
jgi:hypothetical protein